MFSRDLIACLLAVALTACGAGPPILGPTTGTVSGHLQLRACGGAYRPEQTACPTSPLVDAILSFEPVAGSSPATATSDSAGAYRIDLKPGTYRVHLVAFRWAALATSPTASPVAVRGSSEPRTVTVVAGKTVTEDFTYTIQVV